MDNSQKFTVLGHGYGRTRDATHDNVTIVRRPHPLNTDVKSNLTEEQRAFMSSVSESLLNIPSPSVPMPDIDVDFMRPELLDSFRDWVSSPSSTIPSARGNLHIFSTNTRISMVRSGGDVFKKNQSENKEVSRDRSQMHHAKPVITSYLDEFLDALSTRRTMYAGDSRTQRATPTSFDYELYRADKYSQLIERVFAGREEQKPDDEIILEMFNHLDHEITLLNSRTPTVGDRVLRSCYRDVLFLMTRTGVPKNIQTGAHRVLNAAEPRDC